MTSTMISAIPDQRFNRALVFSSQQQDWNGLLVQHYQNSPYLTETELPALSTHWIQLMLREQPTRLIQRRDDSHSERLRQRLHDSIVQTGDSIDNTINTTNQEITLTWSQNKL